MRSATSVNASCIARPRRPTGALLPALFDAARAGGLRYLVIDETHLLSQWGDGFRPAFQMLAGVRRGLLAACAGEKFRTLLMSATLTPETVETIDALFAPKRSVQLIAALHLRPEPRYWIHREDDEVAKRRKVLEALRHAPRPFILYVTKRDDARAWSDASGVKEFPGSPASTVTLATKSGNESSTPGRRTVWMGWSPRPRSA